MKAHRNHIIDRLILAAMRSPCRYRIAAVGYDCRHRIIGIAVNTPRLATRGWHAEETLLHKSPRSLVRIEIIRVGATGLLLPIDACRHCRKLAEKKGVEIVRYMT